MSSSAAKQSQPSTEYVGTRPSKLSLQQLHEKKLSIHGQSTNEQKDAIVDALGGIDKILQDFVWPSDAMIHDDVMDKVEQIIANPHMCKHPHSATLTKTISRSVSLVEDMDNAHHPIKYEFNDEDMILYKLFNKKLSNKIRIIINSKITKILLASIFIVCLLIPLALRSTNVISEALCYQISSIFYWFSGLYLFLWFLFANVVALKMLSKEFIFWFKMLYLVIYLATTALVDYLKGLPLIFICSQIAMIAFLLSLTMITDAMNMSQSAKAFLTAFGLALFASNMVIGQQASFHRLPFYAQSDVQIPSALGFETITFNLVDLSMNAAQVLALFSFKQLVAAIRKPGHASIFKINPLIIYKDHEETIWSMRKLIFVKIGIIAYLGLGVVVGVARIFLGIRAKILWALVPFAEVLGICCLIQGSKKAFYIACIAMLFGGFLAYFGAILFEWEATTSVSFLLWIGLIVTHRLQVCTETLTFLLPCKFVLTNANKNRLIVIKHSRLIILIKQ